MARKGFFKANEIAPAPQAWGQGTKAAQDPCGACGLGSGCLSPMIPAGGGGRLGILVIGEAPGPEEDKRSDPGRGLGVHFVGRDGNLLAEGLRPAGVRDIQKDLRFTNAVYCRPSENKTPTDRQIALCRSHVFQAIQEFKPKKIILLGMSAIKSLYGEFNDIASNGIGPWIGRAVPDMRFGAWVYPVWEPGFIISAGHYDEVIPRIWDEHLQGAVEHDAPFPEMWRDDLSSVRILDRREAVQYLSALAQKTGIRIAFDYETTGLRPYAPGQRVWSIGVAEGPDSAVVFHWHESLQYPWSAVMESERIAKLAHNMKFEDLWTRDCLGIEPRSWSRCTMVMEHVLDNGPSTKGLKFQAAVRFGAFGYGDEISKFLKGRESDGKESKSSNALNWIDQAPQAEVLRYNGLDAMLTFRLADDQDRRLGAMRNGGSLSNAYGLLHEGSLTLSRVESAGICVDLDWYGSEAERLDQEIIRLEALVRTDPQVVKWEASSGKQFNPGSPVAMRDVLFGKGFYGLKPVKKTAKAKAASVDESVMDEVAKSVPFAAAAVRLSKSKKTRNTYLEGFTREQWEGLLHPSFNLHLVRTYRSSSDHPNFQNVPRKDEEAGKATRSGIVPSEGRVLLEVDYSGIEVRMEACNTKDTALIKYLSDPGSGDMHRDQAMELFFLGPEAVPKPLRDVAKSSFVFASFYGSYWKQTGTDMWGHIADMALGDGTPVREHLADRDINNEDGFLRHVKRVEYRLWRKFAGVKKFQDEIQARYKRDGFIDLLTGFRCWGPLSRNELFNYPNQGPGFHCLLWSMNRIYREIQAAGMDSLMVGQIHDSIVFDAVPDEVPDLMCMVQRVMCEDIREAWPWIIVPLEIETDATAIDGNWWEKHLLPEPWNLGD